MALQIGEIILRNGKTSSPKKPGRKPRELSVRSIGLLNVEPVAKLLAPLFLKIHRRNQAMKSMEPKPLA